MIRALSLTALLGLALIYISRFWPFDHWGREGIFGIEALPSRGDLLRRDWLRGTMLRPYDLLIWLGAVFLILTVAERLWSLLRRDH